MAEEGVGTQKPSWIGFISVTLWALGTGFWLMFSEFPGHDDEGYLMMTVKKFLEGGALYDEVYTQYGPAYYVFKWALHSIASLPLTHDVTRLTSLAIWVASSFVSGLLVRQLTRSDILAVIAYGVTFLGLARTIAEPGHPQDLCGLLIVCVLASAATIRNRERLTKPLALTALFLGLLFLVKINLGVFLGLALAIAFLSYTQPGIIKRIALPVLAILAIALPFALFHLYFSIGWLEFSITSALSIAAIIVVERRANRERVFNFMHLAVVAGVFLLTLCAVVALIFIKGTSPPALVQGMFLQNLRFGELFYQAAPIHFLAPYWAVIGFAGALAFNAMSKRLGSDWFIGALKAASGLFIVGFTLLSFFFPNYRYVVLNFAVSFVWLMVARRDDEAGPNFARLALAIGAVLITFQVFPIGGTQLDYANHLPTLFGVVLLGDGLRQLSRLRVVDFAPLALAAAACLIFVSAGIVSYRKYADGVPLGLPGASLIRLPEYEARPLIELTSAARSNCTALYSMPGQMSFNLWTGIETPTQSNTTAWMTLLDDKQQNAMIEALEKSERPCIIYQEKLTRDGLRNTELLSIPLARYILENYHPRNQYGKFIFLTRDKKD